MRKDWAFEYAFWKIIIITNVRLWWRWKFLWFFQYRYYWLTDKSFRKLNRQMRIYKLSKSRQI